VAVAAFRAAGDPAYAADGPAWAPSKLYYSVIPRSALRAFAERLRAAGIETPFGEISESAAEPPFGVDDDLVTTMVDVSRFIGQKRAALEAHRTQMGPEQFFMKLPHDLFAEAFGRETFQRIAGPGPTRETDLFEGLA
jgi:LmbE family N-acetylglucosaminyl deacetylase